MKHELYKELYEMEEGHWWFIGRRQIIFGLINKYIPNRLDRILDVGCGTGLNSDLLRDRGKEIVGLEISEEAIKYAHKRAPWLKVIKGKFPDTKISGSFDLITLFDVLEHIERDEEALVRVRELLSDQGGAMFTVPAFSFLWSRHDELAFHKRRYTIPELRRKLEVAGFKVVKISYFNFIFFLPILAVRTLKNLLGLLPDSTDFFLPAPWLNNILAFVFSLERFWLPNANFPFGVSIIAFVKKVRS